METVLSPGVRSHENAVVCGLRHRAGSRTPRRQRRRMSAGPDGAEETVNLAAEDPGRMAQQIGGGQNGLGGGAVLT